MLVRIYHDGFRIVRMDLYVRKKLLMGNIKLVGKPERTGNMTAIERQLSNPMCLRCE